jgi:Protein of unknown function (DUF1236)
MKKYQTPLLAGVAALALIAGTGLASAQGKDRASGGQGMQPQTTQSPSGQGAAKDTGTQTQAAQPNAGSGPAAAEEGKKPGGKQAQKANRGTNGAKGATAAKPQDQKAGAAADAQTGKGNTSAQTKPEGGEHGAAANAGAGANVKLSEQQRTQIHNTIINGGNAPRVSHVDFDVKVGIVVPRDGVRVVPVPETLVVIEPQWRGFLYFVYADEIVIVSPDDMRIVAVLSV